VKRTYVRFLTGLLALAAVGLLSGCNGGSRSKGSGRKSGKGSDSDEAVLLRYKYPKDQMLRYDTSFKMRSDGKGRVNDTVRAVVYQRVLGPAASGVNSKFHKINIRRREVERKRTERDSNGRNLPVLTATRIATPVITPNHGYDRTLNKNFFPVNDRGMFGLSKERPFHRVAYDSLIYLLPVLPAGQVTRGSAWSADIPVYAGADYFYPAGGFRRGNDFSLSFSGRIDRLYYRAGESFAALSWTCSGTFDTQAFNNRFPARFHTRQRIIHEVRGSGRGVFNVTRGVMVSKSGQATVTFTSRILISRRDKSGKVAGHKWDESVDRHIIHYACRLMGEKESDPRPRRR
jgi:hypothetical protein